MQIRHLTFMVLFTKRRNLEGFFAGNKTDVEICRISLVEETTSDHCKKIVWSYLANYLLEYDRLYEHHIYGRNGDPLGSTTSATCGWKRDQTCYIQIAMIQPFQKNRLGTFCYFQDGNGWFFSFTGSFWQYAISVDRKYLVEYPSREVWLSKSEHGFLPMA
jgi:hypothetical protein